MAPGTRRLVRGALVGALYVALLYIFAPISFYAVQVRIANCLALLPWLWPEAIWGLAIGCFIGNSFGGLGLPDMVAGGLLAVLNGSLMRLIRWRTNCVWLAPLPIVTITPLVIGWIVSDFLHLPYLPVAGYIALGNAVAGWGLAVPLVLLIERLGRRPSGEFLR